MGNKGFPFNRRRSGWGEAGGGAALAQGPTLRPLSTPRAQRAQPETSAWNPETVASWHLSHCQTGPRRDVLGFGFHARPRRGVP